MVRMTDLNPDMAEFLTEFTSPDVPGSPWTEPAPLSMRRVSLVSSAGLRLRGDQAFSEGSADYRSIPVEGVSDVVQDHVSVSHDRTGFQEDINVVFPLQRLLEIADEGAIGSVAKTHYSFMGATDPLAMESSARHLAGRMKADGVNTVILAPV